jgi:tetratricopeptide (TPR) repeat protein
MDVLRRRGRFVDALDEESEDHRPLPETRDVRTLLGGLGQLSDGEVAVLLLREWMDLDVDEVARALDTSAGSVRVLHHRARRKAAAGGALPDALRALDRFLTWLLGRMVWGLPMVGTAAADPHAPADDPGLTQGVLVAYLGLLDAMIELARTQGDHDVEGRATWSRGVARSVLGSPDAIADLERAIALGANPTLAAARLGPLLYTRGDTDRALSTVLSALDRSDSAPHSGVLHRVAMNVYTARGDAAAAAPHVAALRALGEGNAQTAYAAVARGAIAMGEERFADARGELLEALARNRAAEAYARNEASILNNLCFATFSMGELEEAAAWAADGLRLARSVGDRRTEALLIGNRASVLHLQGRLDEAAAGFDEAIALCTENEQYLVGEQLRTRLAAVAHQRGRVEDARALLTGIVDRLAAKPGVSLPARIQLLALDAELGLADEPAFAALEVEAKAPSLRRALALYRALLDRGGLEEALERPAGTTPVERVARAVLERVAAKRHRGR